MLFSFGIILLLGFLIGYLFEKIKLPKIIGMIFIGILLGPSLLNIIDDSLLNISSELRKIALVIVITKAGLSLDINTLKKIGRPAVLMCFIPALFEITATVIFAPLLLPVSYLEALLLGTVLAAVSPAVIVPRMINLKENNCNSKVPDLILAGASLDDIIVILLFYSTLGTFNATNNLTLLYEIPASIISGIAVGLVLGFLFKFLYKKFNIKSSFIVLSLLSFSFILLGIESLIEHYFKYSSLISIIIIAMSLVKFDNLDEVKNKYNFLWLFFEIILFVLVGVSLDLSVATTYLLQAIILLMIILFVRSSGVLVCLLKTDFTLKEKIYSVICYLPKATVQASIGSIALSNGLECGNLILSIAVVSILFTAPIGALLIDKTSTKLLLDNNFEKKQL